MSQYAIALLPNSDGPLNTFDGTYMTKAAETEMI